MNDTNWVNSHYSFFKNNPFLIIYLYENIKKNVIKTLETVNFLSHISVVSLSLNDDHTKIKWEI